jgi:hypothetical protein
VKAARSTARRIINLLLKPQRHELNMATFGADSGENDAEENSK